MKKRLLLAFMAISASMSSFALSQGEFVYTPQGRFQITGANVNANSAFQSMDGWTVIGEGKTLADLFITNADGYAAGINSIQSTASTAGEGIYYKFEPTDAGSTYVVSFKMKGAALDNIKNRIPGDGYKYETNLVKVAGNTAGTYTYPSTEEEVVVNTAEELNENWQTFNYAIQGDGNARTWFISFTAMATTIEIADVQIAPALQFADLRQRDVMLEKMNAYKNCYEWPAEVLADMGYDETIEALQAIGDESGQADLDEQIATAQEILTEFQNANMDDYMAGSYTATVDGGATPAVDMKFNTWLAKVQKAFTWGEWNCLPSGRGFWENESQGAADLGHYAGNSGWNYGNTADPMGVYMQKTLDAGSYVFGIDSRAALREDATSSSWTNNDGWDVAYGIAYIVKIENEVATDTIVSIVKDLDAVDYTQFIISATIAESGTYEIGFKAYCKEAYRDLKNGSVVYVKNASLWGKNNNKYSQKQLGYEADVREQITTGRDNLTKAAEYMADANYFWGKAELKACVDSVETKIAQYETYSQDDIIATYDDDSYVKTNSTKTAEEGLLVFEVYNEAVRDILAANKKFLAVNDTLASIQAAIDDAETALAMRLYSASTGKDVLQSAINSTKDVQSQMKGVDYSEANAATIVATNDALSAAVEVFKTSVPSSAITTIVDIDFEQAAVINDETQLYSITGAKGSMEFSTWSVDGTGNQPFEQGYWSNGEQLWKGYVRIGNGTGTVVFDPTENGSMGTNILRVACDMYIQGLSGRSLGFFLKNVVEGENGPEDAEIFGLFHNFYNNTNTNNTCGVDIDKMWFKSGGSYNNASPADVDEETRTANPLQKSHVEVIMDYGRKSMYCTVSSPNGSATSPEVALEAVPTKFILQCNYNNNDRRAWFDNLKIERLVAGATDPFVDAIQEVNTTAVVKPTKVLKDGRLIINGKYGLNGMIIK